MAEQASDQELAAGWMKDPFGRHFGRYWDGERWTDHVISAETVPSIDPVQQGNLHPEPTRSSEHRTEPGSGQGGPGSWEPDPSGRHSSRYWDGRRWTEHVMSAERVPSIDPVPEGRVAPHRKERAGAGAVPAPAAPRAVPAPADSGSLDSPRAGNRVWAWARSAPWAVAVIVCGLVIVGVALRGGSPRPTKGATNVTGPVATTASPGAPAPAPTTTPLTTEAPTTLPGAPADTGAPATTPVTVPGTAPGSQSPVTSPPSADRPPAVPPPGSSSDPSMSTTS